MVLVLYYPMMVDMSLNTEIKLDILVSVNKRELVLLGLFDRKSIFNAELTDVSENINCEKKELNKKIDRPTF